jgi:hypothetical protein
MKQKKNTDDTKHRKTSSPREKAKTELIPKENFNTGSHSPSSLRDVGAGYDDTGMGDYTKANETNAEGINSRQNKRNKNRGKN